MRKLTDGLMGVVARNTYRIEVWKTRAPKQNGIISDEDYFYFTKINHKGEIGERSIGLSAADLPEFLAILVRAGEKQ